MALVERLATSDTVWAALIALFAGGAGFLLRRWREGAERFDKNSNILRNELKDLLRHLAANDSVLSTVLERASETPCPSAMHFRMLKLPAIDDLIQSTHYELPSIRYREAFQHLRLAMRNYDICVDELLAIKSADISAEAEHIRDLRLRGLRLFQRTLDAYLEYFPPDERKYWVMRSKSHEDCFASQKKCGSEAKACRCVCAIRSKEGRRKNFDIGKLITAAAPEDELRAYCEFAAAIWKEEHKERNLVAGRPPVREHGPAD